MGGSSSTSYIKSAIPDVFTPIAPQRSAPEAMPENIDKASFTSGVKRTDKEKTKATTGASRLVIPLTGNTQAGGYTSPTTAQGVV